MHIMQLTSRKIYSLKQNTKNTFLSGVGHLQPQAHKKYTVQCVHCTVYTYKKLQRNPVSQWYYMYIVNCIAFLHHNFRVGREDNVASLHKI